MHIYYSFDDQAIGTTRDNTALELRRIPRPPGLKNTDWYDHAAKVCRELNIDLEREESPPARRDKEH